MHNFPVIFYLIAFWQADVSEFAPPSRELELHVIDAFSESHDGWSVDEVLLHDGRREAFLTSSERSAPADSDWDQDALCRALLHVRKRGGELPRATKRAVADREQGELLQHVAEISARRLHDELSVHTDALLVSSDARKRFDELAEALVPGCSKYLVRKAALKLRKTRKLEPELLSRVTDWNRTIRSRTAKELASDLAQIPKRPGIYVFYDTEGYVYIGQASNLRTRLEKHLKESDRLALASYLHKDDSDVNVELHVFEEGSPGEALRIRRAYESELIRTRRPRLNVAP